MVMSIKEAALRAIEQMPDDVSFEDLLRGISEVHDLDKRNDDWSQKVREVQSKREKDETSLEPVDFHLERRGRFTVLVPDRPVPPLPASFVNDVIEEMRREREDRWLGLTGQDGE